VRSVPPESPGAKLRTALYMYIRGTQGTQPHMYHAGSCVLAGLALVSNHINDISVLDCELYQLHQLVTGDASEWDTLATACLSPGSLLDSTNCARIPAFHVSGTPVYKLYNETNANAFFESIAMHGSSHCSWFFTDDVACKDVTALRTLGSERRNHFLRTHRSRLAAANAVRQQRVMAVTVLENTIAALCSKHDCSSVRTLYTIDPLPSLPAPPVPLVFAASSKIEL